MSQANRYRGLRPRPENLGVTPLAEGEGTKTYRVRAREDVLAWFGTMTSGERGRFLEHAQAQLKGGEAPIAPQGEDDLRATLAHLAPQDRPALDPANLKRFRHSGVSVRVEGGPSVTQIISEGRGER